MYRGRLFQVRAAAIGNTWSSAVERRVRWTVKLYSGIIGPIGCFWTAMTWCRLHSLRTNSSQHQDRRDDGVQRHAYRGWWWWSSVRPVSAWFVSGFFDTVDHDLLIAVTGLSLVSLVSRDAVLQWFSSYLSGRTFHVVHTDSTSSVIYIPCSLP